MFNKIKKYISENTGFLIRLDDIAENMNWDMMEQASALFDKYKITLCMLHLPGSKMECCCITNAVVSKYNGQIGKFP